MNADRLVVDSSVVIKWFVTEPHSEQARQVLHSYRKRRVSLIVPDLIFAELGNIVWKKQRYQGLKLTQAERIIRAVSRLDLTIVPTNVLIEQAFAFAANHGCTVYDALYLALSRREQCPFVTADQKLAGLSSVDAATVVLVADWRP